MFSFKANFRVLKWVSDDSVLQESLSKVWRWSLTRLLHWERV